MGIFGSMFDFDRDGKLNDMEEFAEFAFVTGMFDKEEEEEEIEDPDTYEEELFEPGELDAMSEDERMAALDEAGLEPEDFGF